MMAAASKLAVLIPAFNAAQTLAGVLDQVLGLSLPVLVVNDGSTDETASVVEGYPAVKALVHPHNRGKGAALKTGFQAALRLGYSHVLSLDADGQHPVEAVPEFLKLAGERPQAILVGDRFADNTIEKMPAVRRWSNGLSSKPISWAAKTRISDAQCGMRVYPLGAISSIELESDGYAMESEVLVKAGRCGVEIVNIPIACHYPQGTKTSGYRALYDSWRIARVVLRSLKQGKRR